MNIPPVSEPTHDAMLAELASLGMRAGRVVVRLIEVEQAAVDVIAAWLPAPGGDTTALADALAEGQAVDAVQAATLVAVPRVEVLARALDRISRSVRRSIALRRRLEAGWLGAGSVDDRAAMVRRQVARSVGEAIRRESDGEAAERLFDELAERMGGTGGCGRGADAAGGGTGAAGVPGFGVGGGCAGRGDSAPRCQEDDCPLAGFGAGPRWSG